MTQEFTDITSKMGKPKWYDTKGFPRYCTFHPNRTSNIYAQYVALILIGCQSCQKTWRVAVSIHMLDVLGEHFQFPTKTDIGSFHYGDPPSHVKHDHRGSTMNSIPIRVIEFWKKRTAFRGWVRIKKYEVFIKEDWSSGILHIQRRQIYLRNLERSKVLRRKAQRKVYSGKKRKHAGALR